MTQSSNQRRLQIVAIGLFVLAAAGSAYLFFVSLKNGSVAGCGRSCDIALTSRWAYLLGIPISAPALFTYLVLIYGLIFKSRSELWQGIFLVAGLMVIGAAIWFTGIQAVLLKTFCKACCAIHACGVIGSLCLLFSLKLPRELKPFGVAAAAMTLMIMAGLQFFVPHTSTADSVLGVSVMTGTRQIVDIGGLPLDIGLFPHRGNPESSDRMVMLFDYTCPGCRRVHEYLSRAEERFGKENYLLVMLPVPLNPDCNRYLKEPMPDHRDACLFAQMGLALWSIDRDKFFEYDTWMIETGSARYPPTAEAASAKAEELVGKKALAEALANPSLGLKIERTTKIWNFLKEKSGRMAMPKIVWSTGILTDGAVQTEFDLFHMMEEQLGLQRVD